MKLQAKLALLMLVVAGLLGTAILGLCKVAVENVERLSRDKEREKSSYFDKLVDLRGAPLQTLAYDYTYWDEMVRFVETRDSKWGTSQLSDAVLDKYGVDALWVYTTDYDLVYSINRWTDTGLAEIPLPIAARDRLLKTDRFRHFFVETPRGPLEVRGATIHPSDDKERRTPPRGYFFVGRLWGDEQRKDLEALMESEIGVVPATAPRPTEAAGAGSEGVIRFSRMLPGWEGSPLLRVDVRSVSPAVRGAYLGTRQAVLVLGGCALVLTAVLALALLRWVSLPLQAITASLDREDPSVLLRLDRNRTEFGRLASVVRRFFEQKQELVREVEERRQAEERARHDALHDSLTGLPNRALFMDRLANALARSRRWEGSAFAVLFVDLDRFKVINDSLGHMRGDQLLRIAARRVLSCVREGDLVARLSGDEFGVLLEHVRDAATPVAVTDRMQRELALPYDLDGHEACTTASVGIALSSTGYDRPEELLRAADTAMYQAKSTGHGRTVVFHDALGTAVLERLSLESDLRRAVDRDELRVHYQPIVSMRTRQIVGFEALVRWQHPVRGLLSPVEFVPLAEETGLIAAIDLWVLREACRQMRRLDARWPAAGALTLAVNVSGKHFAEPGLVEHVEQILTATGFPPRRLRLEITESAIIENAESACEALVRLDRLGVELCLDDFGTGYSSLSYLHMLPVRSLKIDRRFSSRMLDEHEFEIVRTIVMLARKLGMEVVAEGVETTQQLDRLSSLECEFAQGYLFSRPLEAAAAEALVDDRLAPAVAC